jgi:hypothetical protein
MDEPNRPFRWGQRRRHHEASGRTVLAQKLARPVSAAILPTRHRRTIRRESGRRPAQFLTIPAVPRGAETRHPFAARRACKGEETVAMGQAELASAGAPGAAPRPAFHRPHRRASAFPADPSHAVERWRASSASTRSAGRAATKRLSVEAAGTVGRPNQAMKARAPRPHFARQSVRSAVAHNARAPLPWSEDRVSEGGKPPERRHPARTRSQTAPLMRCGWGASSARRIISASWSAIVVLPLQEGTVLGFSATRCSLIAHVAGTHPMPCSRVSAGAPARRSA